MESAAQQVTGDVLPAVYLTGRTESLAMDIRGTMLIHIASSNQGERRNWNRQSPRASRN